MYKTIDDYVNAVIEDVETAETEYINDYSSELDALVDIFGGYQEW